jgi:cell division GTPase FtsZ
MNDAFVLADDVLRQAIQGISDLILVPGMINLDFADVKTIMAGMGIAMMGTGVAEGDTRAVDAARRAISSPLLEGASVDGARGVIINVTGGRDLSLIEVNEASMIIQEAAHEDANIIFGAVVDPSLEGKVKITVIATGFDKGAGRGTAGTVHTPVDLSSYTAHLQKGEAVEMPMLAQSGTDGYASATRAVAHDAISAAVSTGRRRSIDMTGIARSGPIVREPAEGDGGLDTALDVPAFLRRQT